MTIFDQAYKNAMNAPFIEKVQYESSDTNVTHEIDAIFTADEEKERINGLITRKQRYELEYDTGLFTEAVKINSHFIVRGERYRVTSKPIIDEIGMACCQLVKL